jgi:hypothetical protein
VTPTSIDRQPPPARPPKAAAYRLPSRPQPCPASMSRPVPPSTVHPIVRMAERVNAFGCEWWFAGLLTAVFAAAVGRSLCG